MPPTEHERFALYQLLSQDGEPCSYEDLKTTGYRIELYRFYKAAVELRLIES